MIGVVKIQVKPQEIIEAVKGMEKRKREAFLEGLLGATSPEYLKSIREARAGRNVSRKPHLVGGVKGHNINEITLPGSPAVLVPT